MEHAVHPRLLMQFHITGRCNLRCKHCYREDGNVEPLDYGRVAMVIDQYDALRARYNAFYDVSHRGHINITGGEPLLHTDISRIITLLGSQQKRFGFGVLSNGTPLTPGLMKDLKNAGCAFVQLSIDGTRDMHDMLRAPGDYDRTFRAARALEEAGLRAYISFTANRLNMADLPAVAAACRKARVTKLWSDRLVPIGHGEELKELFIGPGELPDYLAHLKKAQGGLLHRLSPTQVTANRALQFLGCRGNLYHCSAGRSLLTVDELGRIMPCRRLPLYCGDVFSSTLTDVYFNHPTFRALRAAQAPEECAACLHRNRCSGGARCQSYAVYGTFDRADPACPFKAAQKNA